MSNFDAFGDFVDEVAIGSTDTRDTLKSAVATVGFYAVLIPLMPLAAVVSMETLDKIAGSLVPIMELVAAVVVDGPAFVLGLVF